MIQGKYMQKYKYGLIGNVLKHSYSKQIHSCFGLNEYALYELDEKEFVDKIVRKDYKGLNITIPYKKKVIEFMDILSEEAREIDAVNTVIHKNGVLEGYNTDFYGFEYMMKVNNINVTGKKVMILGNGGVAQPVFYYMKQHHANYIVVKREASEGIIDYSEAERLNNNVDIIINTSPVGMYPNINESPMTLESYNNLSVVIDLIANPLETKLMKYAREKNIKAIGGITMLVAQAKKAEELFREIKIADSEIEKVTNEIKNMMEQNTTV